MLVIHLWAQVVQETIPAPQTVTAVAQHVDVVHSGLRKCLEAAAHVVQHEHHDDQREHLRVPVGLADCLQSKPTRGASFSQRVVPKDTVSSLLHVACPAAPAAPLALKPLWIRSTAGTAVTRARAGSGGRLAKMPPGCQRALAIAQGRPELTLCTWLGCCSAPGSTSLAQ